MATHFQIVEKTEDGDLVVWSEIFRNEPAKTPFSVECMFDVHKAKGSAFVLTKWTQGDAELTILKRSLVN